MRTLALTTLVYLAPATLATVAGGSGVPSVAPILGVVAGLTVAAVLVVTRRR